tara:strand:+ start:41280 stop:42185 length:906 start_codon:yes stop_codon:yes gene_type:complete
MRQGRISKNGGGKNSKAIIAIVTALLSIVLFAFGIRKNTSKMSEMLRKFMSEAVYEQPDVLDVDINEILNSTRTFTETSNQPHATFTGSTIKWLADRSDFYMIYLSNEPIPNPNSKDWVQQPEPFDPDPFKLIMLDNMTHWLQKMDYEVQLKNQMSEYLTVEVPLNKFYCRIVSAKGNCTPLQQFPQPLKHHDNLKYKKSKLPLSCQLSQRKGNWLVDLAWLDYTKLDIELEIIFDTMNGFLWKYPVEQFDRKITIDLGSTKFGICHLKWSVKGDPYRTTLIGSIFERKFHPELFDSSDSE